MRKTKLLPVLLLALCCQVPAFAQDINMEVSANLASSDVTPYDTLPYYKFRVTLRDKKNNEYSVKHPEAFLSRKAIERRKRQKVKIDKTDLPVSGKYLDMILQTGVRIEHTSKWNNTVLVSTTDSSVVSELLALPCVKDVRKVAYYKGKKVSGSSEETRSTEVPTLDSTRVSFSRMVGALTQRQTAAGKINIPDSNDIYCVASTQIKQLNGKSLHQSGYRGEGMTIAVIDGGFTNADILPVLKNTKVLGTKDFVHRRNDFYNTGSHGMMVLSCMGTDVPGTIVGTAPDASYWLLLSEDGESEQLVEEDNWCAAIEFADSVGADVVNTSLGYANFDAPEDCVKYWQLDGYTENISRSASLCAKKGMVLVCSAGNAGDEQWKLITPPADAKDVLTVGAVTFNNINTNFSSIGFTTDGRIKPDVVALGEQVWLCSPTGMFVPVAGTSFASPILCGMVACLWQALPELNAYEIMDVVRRSGNNASHPDNVYGHGIPDFTKAWQAGKRQ